MKTIVVGIDGSKHAEAALEFAAEEAFLRGAHLLIVYAWEMPIPTAPMALYPVAEAIFDPESFRVFRDDAEDIVQTAAARAVELQPEVASEGKAIEGRPASVLLKEAEHADMIVVGSRGRGGFAGLLLGSVSQQVVHHALCPVVVVR